MKDSPSEILLTLSPTLPPTTKLPTESDRSTNIKHRKPPDPGNEHGEGGGNRADSKQPPDGESSIEPNVRTRDRSNSPRRYGMVDRADPDAHRAQLEPQRQVPPSLCTDGLNEIQGSRS
ncbi:hypothetical protein LOK49_LG06G02179 [Camellia lanceoleosa]|uniref:Uncharacterized protein n=1 Tax=Camellia lanceoleosa TaxID=1840588 RepID=A0ACC0HDW1_9ERIC|nr:hypothetical protein LOK49_LG06G02179 [Camellia lanceoleosa]